MLTRGQIEVIRTILAAAAVGGLAQPEAAA